MRKARRHRVSQQRAGMCGRPSPTPRAGGAAAEIRDEGNTTRPGWATSGAQDVKTGIAAKRPRRAAGRRAAARSPSGGRIEQVESAPESAPGCAAWAGIVVGLVSFALLMPCGSLHQRRGCHAVFVALSGFAVFGVRCLRASSSRIVAIPDLFGPWVYTRYFSASGLQRRPADLEQAQAVLMRATRWTRAPSPSQWRATARPIASSCRRPSAPAPSRWRRCRSPFPRLRALRLAFACGIMAASHRARGVASRPGRRRWASAPSLCRRPIGSSPGQRAHRHRRWRDLAPKSIKEYLGSAGSCAGASAIGLDGFRPSRLPRASRRLIWTVVFVLLGRFAFVATILRWHRRSRCIASSSRLRGAGASSSPSSRGCSARTSARSTPGQAGARPSWTTGPTCARRHRQCGSVSLR